MCLMASVFFFTMENCCANSSTVSPKRPTWENGCVKKANFHISAMLSHRWRSWTTQVRCFCLPRQAQPPFQCLPQTETQPLWKLAQSRHQLLMAQACPPMLRETFGMTQGLLEKNASREHNVPMAMSLQAGHEPSYEHCFSVSMAQTLNAALVPVITRNEKPATRRARTESNVCIHTQLF